MSLVEGNNLYLSIVRDQIPRLLSLEDREPFSKTYGCFDRTHWGWKFTDFPGARFQEGVYTLAYLFCRSFVGNSLIAKDRVLEWARAGMNFWQKIQYADGSFDEAYPYEHSLAATAFTSFYIGEAFLLLQVYIHQQEQTELRRTFARAGDWLCKNDEYHGVLSNHLAVAAAALNIIYRICGEDKYQKRSNYFLQRIYDHQSPEGWYEEYGGADPGYQTHGTFYLARLWQFTQDAELFESLRNSLTFLKHFIHPNGTLGGEYGSRNTEFYFPAGLEILAHVLPEAALIAHFMRPAITQQTTAGLITVDIYNFFPMLNNYIFAAEHAQALDEIEGILPCQEKEGQIYFPQGGLFVKNSPAYYAVLGLSKGGVLKIYDRTTGNLHTSDCGYWAEVNNRQIISNQSLGQVTDWQVNETECMVHVNFVQVNQHVQSPWSFIGFRLFTLTLGRLPAVAYWIKNLLVHLLVRRRRKTPLRLLRRVHFEADAIFISDKLELTRKLQVHTLRSGEKFSTIHMGSSRYFQPQELIVQPNKVQDRAAELMQNQAVWIEHKLHIPRENE